MKMISTFTETTDLMLKTTDLTFETTKPLNFKNNSEKITDLK